MKSLYLVFLIHLELLVQILFLHGVLGVDPLFDFLELVFQAGGDNLKLRCFRIPSGIFFHKIQRLLSNQIQGVLLDLSHTLPMRLEFGLAVIESLNARIAGLLHSTPSAPKAFGRRGRSIFRNRSAS